MAGIEDAWAQAEIADHARTARTTWRALPRVAGVDHTAGMEFVLLAVIVGFAVVGVIKATRQRRASGHRAFGTTGHAQAPGADPTFDVGGGHHHSSGHDGSSADSSADSGGNGD